MLSGEDFSVAVEGVKVWQPLDWGQRVGGGGISAADDSAGWRDSSAWDEAGRLGALPFSETARRSSLASFLDVLVYGYLFENS